MKQESSFDRWGEVNPGFLLNTTRMVSRSHGILFTPDLGLKLYSMSGFNADIPAEKLRELNGFLEGEILRGKIDPEIGLGFAIYSPGYLNVARWRKENPIVLRNSLYEFYPSAPLNTALPGDLNAGGAFCVWELGIVAHEREAWKKYLTSKRAREDKVQYLIDFIEGDL